MPPHRFFEYLSRSFFVLKMENRNSYNGLVSRFGAMQALLECDREARLISTVNGNMKISEDVSGAGPQICFEKSTILDLVDAQLSIQEALYSDQLRVMGALDDLEVLNDCLFIYLHAAIRCRGIPPLLDEFRCAVVES